MDAADDAYKAVLANTNQKQQMHYTKELPYALDQMQAVEENRVEFLRQLLSKFARGQLEMMPALQTILTKIATAAELIDKSEDSRLFVQSNKTGQGIPPAINYENPWVS